MMGLLLGTADITGASATQGDVWID